jgi:hypothetical protein
MNPFKNCYYCNYELKSQKSAISRLRCWLLCRNCAPDSNFKFAFESDELSFNDLLEIKEIYLDKVDYLIVCHTIKDTKYRIVFKKFRYWVDQFDTPNKLLTFGEFEADKDAKFSAENLIKECQNLIERHVRLTIFE